MDYDEYDFNIKGIIKVDSPEGVISITTPQLKEALYNIAAFNKLLGVCRIPIQKYSL
ncbi:hypothetical protein [Sulfurimonas sediminis]|uniref:hypothetical protein n=1 Tax=Sulfurimonas sediminis TaxID=2590020 RepID=UPI0018685CFA|nr:hypothetical protein [Sulfurimonas sediminis]